MKIKVFYFNAIRECCYVLWDDGGECVIIDPGCYGENEFSRLVSFVEENGLTPVKILLTHGHFDHTFGLENCRERWNVPVLIHRDDIVQVDRSVEMAGFCGLQFRPYSGTFTEIVDGQTVTCGRFSLKVLHTPGHTAGSVCYLCSGENAVFTGDTLFQGSVGRTDLPGGDAAALESSLARKIAVLPPETDVYSGHGYPTTIGTELADNPYMSRR